MKFSLKVPFLLAAIVGLALAMPLVVLIVVTVAAFATLTYEWLRTPRR